MSNADFTMYYDLMPRLSGDARKILDMMDKWDKASITDRMKYYNDIMSYRRLMMDLYDRANRETEALERKKNSIGYKAYQRGKKHAVIEAEEVPIYDEFRWLKDRSKVEWLSTELSLRDQFKELSLAAINGVYESISNTTGTRPSKLLSRPIVSDISAYAMQDALNNYKEPLWKVASYLPDVSYPEPDKVAEMIKNIKQFVEPAIVESWKEAAVEVGKGLVPSPLGNKDWSKPLFAGSIAEIMAVEDESDTPWSGAYANKANMQAWEDTVTNNPPYKYSSRPKGYTPGEYPILKRLWGLGFDVMSKGSKIMGGAKDRLLGALSSAKSSIIEYAKALPMMGLKTIGRLIVSELLHITTMSFDITKKLFFMPAKTLVNGLHNILKSAASQSQIIQSIMQLTIIPFVLMFEYLLLPVVKAIIPIITNMVKIIATNKDSIMKWGEVLADFITKVVSPVLSMFDGKFFSNPLSGVFDIMTGMMNGAAEWIRNNSVELSNVLLSTIESAGKFLASNAEVAATLAISIADSISNYLRSDNFKEIYPTIKDAFVTILQCVRQVLTDPAIVTLMKDLVWQFATTLVDVAIDILRGGNSYSESLNAIDKYGLDYTALKDPEFKKLVEDYNNKMSWYDNLLFDFERNGQDKMYNEKYGMGYKDYYNNKYDSDMNLYYITHNYGSSSTDTFGKDGAISY